MAFGKPVYSVEQRGAVQQAAERKVGPDRTVVALAAAGELTYDGEIVPAFALSIGSAGDIRRRYAKKREKQLRRELAEQSPRDSVEKVRQRLAVAINEQLDYIERLQARGQHSKVNVPQIREIARAARELAALPGPEGEPARGRKPGDRLPGERLAPDSRTRGGLGAQILATTKPRSLAPAQYEPPTPTSEDVDTSGGAATQTDNEDENERVDGGPGDYAREQAARLLA